MTEGTGDLAGQTLLNDLLNFDVLWKLHKQLFRRIWHLETMKGERFFGKSSIYYFLNFFCDQFCQKILSVQSVTELMEENSDSVTAPSGETDSFPITANTAGS